VVPPHHSADIQAVAPQARLLRLPDAGHGDVQEFEAYRQALRDALASLPDHAQDAAQGYR
jgi:pimeloyl-ACP methyl ester carboxylesterase